MMRGVRFCLSLLLALGMPAAALASHFIPMERAFLKIPDSSSKVVQKDFSEGKRKMHFLGGRTRMGSPALVAVRKGHFLELDSALWQDIRPNDASRHITYIIEQLKDTDTGRFSTASHRGSLILTGSLKPCSSDTIKRGKRSRNMSTARISTHLMEWILIPS